jgi:predicted DsbA family dithiol-disulfide isomerase
MRLEIFSDVVCPWCFIGKQRFDRAVKNLTTAGFNINLEVFYRPFQLDPTAPLDAPTPVRDAYAKKFGTPERASEILDHVTSIALAEGLNFRMDIALRANTSRAHQLITFAQTTDLDHTKLKELLMIAYFCNGKDISNIDTLIDIATTFGLDKSQVSQLLKSNSGQDQLEAELIRARDIGVTAVPTYIFNEQWSVPGAQDSETFERVLKKLTQEETS